MTVELPKPAWFAIETPGADVDVTFVQTREEALEYIEHPDDFDTLVTKLFTAEQVAELIRYGEEIAEWHIGDGDECGLESRNFVNACSAFRAAYCKQERQ